MAHLTETFDGGRERALIGSILDRMYARRAQIAEQMVQACRAEIPEYAALDGESLGAVVAHSVDHVELFVRAARRGSPPSGEELEFVYTRAAERARGGTPVEVLLRAYRMGQRETLRAIVEAAGDEPGAAQAALSLSNTTMSYTDAISTQATAAYVDVHGRMLTAADRARRELFEDLLINGEALDPEHARRAAALGLDCGAALVVISVLADRRGAGPDGPARAEEAIAESMTTDRAPFIVVRRDEIVAIGGAGRDDGRALARSLRSRLQTSATTLRVGVSKPSQMPAELVRGCAEARAALAHATPGRCAVALAEVRLFDHLTRHADSTTERVVPDAARRLWAADAKHGGALIETLQQYRLANLNAARAAAALYVHPNTVHYRLRKIEEITGMSTRQFDDFVELLAGLAVLGTLSQATRTDHRDR